MGSRFGDTLHAGFRPKRKINFEPSDTVQMALIYQFLGKNLVLKHSERGSMQSLC